MSINRYTNSPVANYKGELYNLPFNMNTFYQMWGVRTPEEAKAKIEEQKKESGIKEPKNLEEQAISLIGNDIYEKLVKGYTQKQWGKECTELPSFIIKRLPVRFTYDNNYFNDSYQGIPIGGYTKIIEKLLEGIEVRLNTDFFDKKEEYMEMADKVLFTGMIDQYFDYCFGELEYRGSWTPTTIREMLSLIIQMQRLLSLELLNTSILKFQLMNWEQKKILRKQLLLENIQNNGKKARKHIIQ